jgi:deoxyribodipyrimidine photo-lyase
MQDRTKKALIWLRNDLRLTDHFGFNATSKNFQELVVYYSMDPQNFRETPWGFKKTEAFRTQFLLETLTELKASLKKKKH